MIPFLGRPIHFSEYTAAKIIAHFLPWFGTPGHIEIGYISSNIQTCDAQVQAMFKMGISGINVDYYGPDSPSALACLRICAACERGGLSYSLCIDKGALGNLVGELATQEYIRILRFSSEAFFLSPFYLKDAGRCVVNFFGEPAGVNWPAIRAAIPTKMAMLFQGDSGMTHLEADGAYGWVNPLPDPSDINLPALQSFLSAAKANPQKLAFYPVYTGFDDSMARWGKKRFMSRRLGHTLIDTLKLIPVAASYALLATFNDHEEGSSVEHSQG